MSRTKFPFRVWRWTGADESLFDLDRATLETFKQLTIEASK